MNDKEDWDKAAGAAIAEDARWADMRQAAHLINEWANRTFPGRPPRSSLVKLNMEEIPELLTHLKEHGSMGIGEEWADCMILLLDLAVIWKVDPVVAIRNKMQVNERRTWGQDRETGMYTHIKVQGEVDQSSAEEVRRQLHERGEA